MVGLSTRLVAIASLGILSGCGTYIPAIQEPWEGTKTPIFSPGGLLEYKVKRKIYCDIAEAVRVNYRRLPKDWAVQSTLDLQVDETGALNPGVTFIDPLPSMQSMSYAVGATLSSQATHEDKFSSYWKLDKLVLYKPKMCDNPDTSGSSPLLTNELGIVRWLTDAVGTVEYLPSSDLTKEADPAFKQDSLTYHVKFIVITAGNFTPSWKLLRISANTGNTPLANINRTRTHDLLLTFGPAFKANRPNVAGDSHLSAEIGIAVSNGNRLNQQVP